MSALRVQLIPIFIDNYIFMIVDEKRKQALVVDPGEAPAVERFLKSEQLTLMGILITHHHNDHIDGARELQEKLQVPLFAPLKNKHQLPFANTFVEDGDILSFGSFQISVLELPGHTLGHVAYWLAEKKWLFSGDVLFGLGCGRIFEGTNDQMFQSLQVIKNLPAETLIYCTHEYTERNLEFTKMLTRLDDAPITGDDEHLALYENELKHRRALDLPSVPLKLDIEKQVNAFLLASSVRQFTYLRELRNKQ